MVSCWFTIQSFINLKILFHKKVIYISQMFKNESHLVVISPKKNSKRTLGSFSRKTLSYSLQFYKKGLQHRNFPVSFTKFLWTFFVQNTFQRLTLVPHDPAICITGDMTQIWPKITLLSWTLKWVSSNIGGAQVQIWSKDHWKLNIVKIYGFKACSVRKKAPSQITVEHD